EPSRELRQALHERRRGGRTGEGLRQGTGAPAGRDPHPGSWPASSHHRGRLPLRRTL
ncbi:MAG: hypothetical protein AVDCRST_MAG06-1933, partial [uncultured Nocardioides sp.]